MEDKKTDAEMREEGYHRCFCGQWVEVDHFDCRENAKDLRLLAEEYKNRRKE